MPYGKDFVPTTEEEYWQGYARLVNKTAASFVLTHHQYGAEFAKRQWLESLPDFRKEAGPNIERGEEMLADIAECIRQLIGVDVTKWS
jgi:hypothetical protein